MLCGIDVRVRCDRQPGLRIPARSCASWPHRVSRGRSRPPTELWLARSRLAFPVCFITEGTDSSAEFPIFFRSKERLLRSKILATGISILQKRETDHPGSIALCFFLCDLLMIQEPKDCWKQGKSLLSFTLKCTRSNQVRSSSAQGQLKQGEQAVCSCRVQEKELAILSISCVTAAFFLAFLI